MSTTEVSPKAERKLICRYVYPRPEGYKATAEKGNLWVDDPEDPIWEGAFAQAPYNGDPHGALEIAEVLLVDGEIVKTKAICGGPCHKNKAQETMKEFHRLKALGSATPWDQERHFRDALIEADRAAKEGRAEELSLLKQALMTLVNRPQTPNEVSGGSLVTDSNTKKKDHN